MKKLLEEFKGLSMKKLPFKLKYIATHEELGVIPLVQEYKDEEGQSWVFWWADDDHVQSLYRWIAFPANQEEIKICAYNTGDCFSKNLCQVINLMLCKDYFYVVDKIHDEEIVEAIKVKQEDFPIEWLPGLCFIDLAEKCILSDSNEFHNEVTRYRKYLSSETVYKIFTKVILSPKFDKKDESSNEVDQRVCDYILDTMDRLTGWCHPNNSLVGGPTEGV